MNIILITLKLELYLFFLYLNKFLIFELALYLLSREEMKNSFIVALYEVASYLCPSALEWIVVLLYWKVVMNQYTAAIVCEFIHVFFIYILDWKT